MNQVHSGPADRVVIIGGGVIGGMCAWYLTEAGMPVTLVERDRFGAACSHGNCGYVCPSHVLPLCQPGAVGSTMRSLLQRNSPFAIKPRLSRAWISWFWNFARQCNQKDMLETGTAIHALLQSSLSLYRELVQGEGIDCEWQERGLLYVHDHEKGFEAYRKTERLIRDQFGIGATPYTGAALHELEPALLPGPYGAWHYEGDCHIRPDKLLSGLRSRLEAKGVQFLEGEEVKTFESSGGRTRSVTTARGTKIPGEHFVVAAGALSPFLGKPLGLRIPIEPGKGYSITMSKPAEMPRHPLIFEDSHVAITPMKTGYRIGSTMEFVGYNTTIHEKRLALLTQAAKKYLADPFGPEIQERWYGWRPMTWDGKPIIDRSPALQNVWIAAGHNMLGLSLATGTGKLVAEMISGSETHIDPTPYGVARLR